MNSQNPISIWGPGLLILATLGSAAPDTNELVRQGNAAYANGDYGAAEVIFERAEERTPDPGLVAFNEAASLYQLGRYREAELHYQRSREDAVGVRRARLLYNLGNCILKQARRQTPRRLREAIASYEACLREEGSDAELAADARHNLELARLLLQKAGSRQEEQSHAEEEPNHQRSAADDPKMDVRPGDEDTGSAVPDANGKAGATAEQAGKRNPSQARTNDPPPGKGDLPPIPDEDDLATMSPEDAVKHLQRATSRILQERREYRQRPVPAGENVLDW